MTLALSHCSHDSDQRERGASRDSAHTPSGPFRFRALTTVRVGDSVYTESCLAVQSGWFRSEWAGM